MNKNENGSHTEHDACLAERYRVQVTSEDKDPTDLMGAQTSTWNPSQRILDEASAAPLDEPPFM